MKDDKHLLDLDVDEKIILYGVLGTVTFLAIFGFVSLINLLI